MQIIIWVVVQLLTLDVYVYNGQNRKRAAITFFLCCKFMEACGARPINQSSIPHQSAVFVHHFQT